MLNCVVIMGRLTADPELRKTPSGVSVTRIYVAVDRDYAKAGEERKTDFITVVCWRQTAEFVCKYFSKGQMIAVQGSLETSSYDKNGYRYYSYEIRAEKVSFCGSKAESGTDTAKVTESAPTPTSSNGNADNFADFAAALNDDELPF